MKRSLYILAAALVLTFGLALGPAHATFTITDGNASLDIDPNSSAGAFNFRVDGVDQLFQQWYWVGIGNAQQQPINTISAPTVTVGTNHADVDYANATTQASVGYDLHGGLPGTHTADIGETFTLNNVSATTQTYRVFFYSDFDLGNTLGNQTVQISADRSRAFQTIVGSNAWRETTQSFPADHVEAALFADTLNKLNTTNLAHLNDVLFAGPGDATFAFEYDVTLGPGGSFIFSSDNLVVPVPPAVWLFGSGLVGLLGLRFRRNRA